MSQGDRDPGSGLQARALQAPGFGSAHTGPDAGIPDPEPSRTPDPRTPESPLPSRSPGLLFRVPNPGNPDPLSRSPGLLFRIRIADPARLPSPGADVRYALMDDLKRREFLKLGGAAVAAAALPDSRPRGAAAGHGAVQRSADRDGAHRLRRDRRAGLRPRQEPARRFPAAASPPSATSGRSAPTGRPRQITAAGHPRAGRLHARAARLRAPVRDRGRSISSTTRRRGNSTSRSCSPR